MIKKTVWHLSRRLYYFALWRFTQMRMSFRNKYKIQNRTGNTIRTNRKPKENYQKHLDWHLFQKLSRQGKQTIPYLINYDHIENNIILKILNVFWYWKPTMGGWYQSVGRIIFSQYHNFFTKNCALSNMFPLFDLLNFLMDYFLAKIRAIIFSLNHNPHIPDKTIFDPFT